MKSLSETGKYTVDDSVKAKLDELFFGGSCDDKGTQATIKKTYDEEHYLCDTHTAVAVNVYEQYVEKTGDKATPAIIASTASPYKFTRSVMNAIDSKYDSMGDFELVDELSKISNVKVPNAIEEIRTAPVLHDTVCDSDKMCDEVKKILGI